MRFTRWKAASIAAAVSVFVFTGGPAQGVGSTMVADASGVDYDAACVANSDLPPPGPDATGSPGTSPCGDGSGVTLYDGSTESTDIRDIGLASDPNGRFVARCTVDQPIVPAGSPVRPIVDLPENNVFMGASCKVMFQNKNKETNLDNPQGGCTRVDGMRVRDQHGAWQDGFHFFVGFSQLWDGTQWVHSAQIGEYDPSPDGGFAYYEIANSRNPGVWTGPAFVTITGSTVTITISGVTVSRNSNCLGGLFRSAWGTPGDVIANVKGLSSADTSSMLPVTIPLALSGVVDDLDAVGGYTWFSDTTLGTSTAGMLNTNIPNIAYTTGASERSRGGSTFSQGPAQGQAADGPRPCCDPVDTLGEGPTCPTPTFGGMLPANPMFSQHEGGCMIDDDSFSRGSLLPEFWDTPFSFVF